VDFIDDEFNYDVLTAPSGGYSGNTNVLG